MKLARWKPVRPWAIAAVFPIQPAREKVFRGFAVELVHPDRCALFSTRGQWPFSFSPAGIRISMSAPKATPAEIAGVAERLMLDYSVNGETRARATFPSMPLFVFSEETASGRIIEPDEEAERKAALRVFPVKDAARGRGLADPPPFFLEGAVADLRVHPFTLFMGSLAPRQPGRRAVFHQNDVISIRVLAPEGIPSESTAVDVGVQIYGDEVEVVS